MRAPLGYRHDRSKPLWVIQLRWNGDARDKTVLARGRQPGGRPAFGIQVGTVVGSPFN